MKKITKIIIILCTLMLSANIYAQDYTVMYVNGSVKAQPASKPIKIGDKLAPDVQVVFASKNDALGLINTKGRYTAKLRGIEEEGDVVELQKFTQQAKSRFNIPRQNMTQLQDLQRNFELNAYVILDTSAYLLVNPVAFPMNKTSYFYVTYEYEGKEVTEQLSFFRNKLSISESVIYGNRNPKKVKEIYLFYYNFNKDDSILISAFTLNFIKDHKKLKEEAGILVNALIAKKAMKSEICNEVTNFMNEFYGNINADDLFKWLDKHYQIHNY